MPITFDYEDWDSSTESIPIKKGIPENRLPFTAGFLIETLLGGAIVPKGDRLRGDLISTLQACLTITLNRFRQLGVSAGDLQRLVKAYPLRGKPEVQVLLDAALVPANRISNPNNFVVQAHQDDRYVVRQDTTGLVWTWYPK